MELPAGYQLLAVASIDAVGLNEKQAEAVLWLTAPNGLKVCLTCDLAGLRRALATVVDNQTKEERRDGLKLVQGA